MTGAAITISHFPSIPPFFIFLTLCVPFASWSFLFLSLVCPLVMVSTLALKRPTPPLLSFLPLISSSPLSLLLFSFLRFLFQLFPLLLLVCPLVMVSIRVWSQPTTPFIATLSLSCANSEFLSSKKNMHRLLGLVIRTFIERGGS